MPNKITRRQLIAGAALTASVGAYGSPSALEQIAVGPGAHAVGDALVVLFLRGGADGLNIVAPYGDPDYSRLRPSLALARPGDRSAPAAARALDLDGFFGLHPALQPLWPLYKEGHLTPIHAVGSGDQTRSHFEAMATMERGLESGTGEASGWLARYLNATADPHDSPLRAVSLTETMPDSLRGSPTALALTSLSDYRLHGSIPTGTGNVRFHGADRTSAMAQTIGALYGAPGSGGDALRTVGRETLAALDAVARLDPKHYRPAPAAHYPAGPVGDGFRQTACLIKGEIGLEVACLEMGGWDTHVAQGRDAGWQPLRLAELGSALGAFAADLGPHLAQVTTIVMTEFGRRAYENTGLGTDHGRASCMFVLGGGVRGGKVHAVWPGLSKGQLDGPGDLRVTTDYRDVLCEVLAHRRSVNALDVVFPGYTPRALELMNPVRVTT